MARRDGRRSSEHTPKQLAKRSAERSDIDPGFTLPPRPSTRLRRRLVAAVLVTAGGLVVLVVVFSGGPQGLRRHWLATTVAELFLTLTVGRLLWTTRPPRAPA